MIVKNISKNTVYIDDLDLHIPYSENCFELLPNQLRKSKQLQTSIFNSLLEIISYNKNEQIEKAVVYNFKKFKKDDNVIDKIDESSQTISLDVCIKGIFYEAGGYGKVNRYFAKNLSNLGVNIKIVPKKGQNQLSLDELRDIVRLESTRISKKYVAIDSVIPSFSDVSGAPYKILYTTVEAHSLPKSFIDCCNAYNEIWSTSPFAHGILKKYLKNKKMFVVPTGVDPEIYNESVEPITFNPSLKRFVFLSVFGWSYRKGYDLLLKSYFEAFTDKDDVSLLIFSRYMQGVNPAYQRKIQSDIDKLNLRKKNAPHYVISSKILPEKMMPRLYRSCQAFILVSRGESTGLPPGEASLCGLPVIMTNTSGQTLYLRSDNSYLLEIDKLERVVPGSMHLHYWDNQLFPLLKSKKTIKELAGLMREVYENYDRAKERNKKLQELLINNFTWNKVAKIGFDRLKEIERGNCIFRR